MFCLQQADRIIAVGHTGEPPEGMDRPELRGCDLVAWEVEPGSGALSDWADALEPIETHAIHRSSIDEDIQRTARRLAGRSVGIVLSGGGARAFAHIGVLEELEAAGLVIDRVAGVSMGAFVGGMFAMGMSGDEIDARCYEEWIRRRPLGDYTLPRFSLIRGIGPGRCWTGPSGRSRSRSCPAPSSPERRSYAAESSWSIAGVASGTRSQRASRFL